MRNLKELLLVLLIGITDYMVIESQYDGLCGVINGLEYDDTITYKEKNLLEDYIEEHMPHDYSNSIDCLARDVYGWKPGNASIRIKWLNRRIKKLS